MMEGETYAIAQVFNEVFHLKVANSDLGIHPTAFCQPCPHPSPSPHSTRYSTHHFVNVFCWTLIHFCCSAYAILSYVRALLALPWQLLSLGGGSWVYIPPVCLPRLF